MRVLVLAGGSSPEREVSLDSGECVAAAIRSMSHEVDMLDPATTPILAINPGRWDIVFPVVHGTGGEDGLLQSELAAVGIPYVGSSRTASELTFDKIRTNQLAGENGFRVPDSVVVHSWPTLSEQQATVESLNAFEAGGVVTKPPRQGSSIGISIVRKLSELRFALDLAFRYENRCLVERYIAGREVTVPVIDGVAFPAIEICPSAEWYDYTAKYVDDRTRYVVSPPNMPDTLAQTAVDICLLCGVEGIARVDFRVDTAGCCWLLEINTVPGMTSHSLVPKSAAATGLSLGELCEMAMLNQLSRTAL